MAKSFTVSRTWSGLPDVTVVADFAEVNDGVLTFLKKEGNGYEPVAGFMPGAWSSFHEAWGKNLAELDNLADRIANETPDAPGWGLWAKAWRESRKWFMALGETPFQ